mmetsp:Transcript_13510/g.43158  ORF Transcript_13510/g.43158 Transcript_13510/m.43158 type:complete len:231 (+) Transcript_13510:1300-1992(+)
MTLSTIDWKKRALNSTGSRTTDRYARAVSSLNCIHHDVLYRCLMSSIRDAERPGVRGVRGVVAATADGCPASLPSPLLSEGAGSPFSSGTTSVTCRSPVEAPPACELGSTSASTSWSFSAASPPAPPAPAPASSAPSAAVAAVAAAASAASDAAFASLSSCAAISKRISSASLPTISSPATSASKAEPVLEGSCAPSFIRLACSDPANSSHRYAMRLRDSVSWLGSTASR